MAPSGDLGGLGKQRKVFGGGGQKSRGIEAEWQTVGETGAVEMDVRYHLNYDFPSPFLTYNMLKAFWGGTTLPQRGRQEG